MARPDHRKAAKDYPAQGIKKGDMYWYVKLKLQRGGVVKRQLSPFKRSQLTTSAFKGSLYDWEDARDDLTSMDGAQDLAETIRGLGEETRGSFDNMPEGLQQGETGQMLETRAEACETAASSIEEIISECESAQSDWDSEIETYREELAAYEASKAAYDEWEAADDEDAPEPTVEAEPDLPDHTNDNGEGDYSFDDSEFVDKVKEVSVDE